MLRHLPADVSLVYDSILGTEGLPGGKKLKLCTYPTRIPILQKGIICLHDVSMNEQWLYRLHQKTEHHFQLF